MKRVKTLVFSKFSIDDNHKANHENEMVVIFRSLPYTDETGYGFKNTFSQDRVVTSTLVRKSSTFIQDYDTESQELIKKQIYLFSLVTFSVDIAMGILVVDGSVANTNTVKAIFRNVLTFNYSTDPVSIDLVDFSNSLRRSNIKANVSQITVKSFIYKNGIIGRFSGDVLDEQIGQEVISSYKHDVVKAVYKIQRHNEADLILQLFPNGSVKILVEEEEFLYHLNFVKNLIFK